MARRTCENKGITGREPSGFNPKSFNYVGVLELARLHDLELGGKEEDFCTCLTEHHILFL